jgi:hypothetical protein
VRNVSSMSFQRQALLGSLTFWAVIICGVLAANTSFYFSNVYLPWSDYAANDILVEGAQHSLLLHGNYSRVGFYHPGPFFLWLLLASEMVFTKLIPIFSTTVAAHFFGSLLWFATSMAFLFRLLALASRSLVTAAVGCCAAIYVLFLVCGSVVTSAWMPHLYMSAALQLATGVIGVYALGPRWLLLATFGMAQLIHGHASFIGLSVIMTATFLLPASVFPRATWQTLRSAVANNSQTLRRCGAIALAFALPIVFNTILHWPGEVPKYFSFAGHAQPNSIAATLEYTRQFLPFSLIALSLLALPLRIRRDSDQQASLGTFRRGILAATAGGVVAGLFYARYGVDHLEFRYVMFWLASFDATLVAASATYAMSLFPRPIALVLACVVLALCLPVLSLYKPVGTDVWAPTLYDPTAKRYPEALADLEALAAAGQMSEIYVEPSSEIATSWADVLTLVAMMNRRHERAFCITPDTWTISYHEKFRCEAERDSPGRRIVVSHREIEGTRLVTQTGATRFMLVLPLAKPN